MVKSILRTFPVRFAAAFLVAGAAILGCSSHAGERGAGTAQVQARMVYYAMPG